MTMKTTMKKLKSKLTKKLDKVFSKFIRLSQADSEGNVVCCTCGVTKHWKKIQCGHYQSRRKYATRWSIYNCAPQCMKCNIFSQGEQVKFKYYIDRTYPLFHEPDLNIGPNTMSCYVEELSETNVTYSYEVLEGLISGYTQQVNKYLKQYDSKD